MTRTAEVPLAQTFREQAEDIWGWQTFAHKHGINPGEDSITDRALYEIQKAHPTTVVSRRHNQREEVETGADWEWWITHQGSAIPLLAQAKRLFFNENPDGKHTYASLSEKHRQHQSLIETAHSKDMIPLYVFFNAWLTGKGEEWGATVCPATVVAHIIENNGHYKQVDKYLPYSIPWHELFQEFPLMSGAAVLTHIVEMIDQLATQYAKDALFSDEMNSRDRNAFRFIYDQYSQPLPNHIHRILLGQGNKLDWQEVSAKHVVVTDVSV